MKIQAVRGMHDLFGQEIKKYNHVVDCGKQVAFRYGFESIQTPILEFCELFERNLGSESDVVAKEIYRFNDRGDNVLALRPEFTAGVARAFAQHSMYAQVLPKKLFSYGQLFRYDRPQAGRYRQFNQLNFEVIGASEFMVDAECILMGYDLLGLCEIKDFILNINFLGSPESRASYAEILVKYFEKHVDKLSEDSKKRLKKEPLRILDSKDPKDHEIILHAPLLSEQYSDSERQYFDSILGILDDFNVKYIVNPRLVRGLDYYTGVVFEFVTSVDGLSVIGGGRYDNLIGQISGKIALPAVGFAVGVERMMLNLGSKIVPAEKIGIIYYSEKELRYSLGVAQRLRDRGRSVEVVYCSGSVGKKIGKAEKLGCSQVVVCGPEEAEKNIAKIKDLSTGEERPIEL